MKKLFLLLALAATPAAAQDMPGMDMKTMPGMSMKDMAPAKKPPPKKARPGKVSPPEKSPAAGAADPAPASKPVPVMAMPQDPASAPQPQMAGMAMEGHPMAMHGMLGGYGMSREASGTSWQPQAAPHTGIMLMPGEDWMVMLHGRVNGVADWQSGPRGDHDTFSSSMLMAMASKDLANGDTLGLHGMFSGDPFMGRRGYPLLLASGETANGVTPLVDRQHPHDLVMELAASYSHPLSADDSLFVYGGYPGESALGPSAYMHRISAEDNPMTPISHHWLDSTHVSFGVATAGWVHDGWKLEVSRFTGREPDQYRFNFDPARFDSTAVRLSYNPDDHWSLQVSEGWLESPEKLTPAINERRRTASATWFDRFDFGAVAATLAFGKKRLSNGVSESAGLAEAEYHPDDAWTLFGRAETLGSDELVPSPPSGPVVRGAGEVSLGLIHDWPIFDPDGAGHFKAGLGGLYALDFAPSSTTASYGRNPHGGMVFVRLVAQ